MSKTAHGIVYNFDDISVKGLTQLFFIRFFLSFSGGATLIFEVELLKIDRKGKNEL